MSEIYLLRHFMTQNNIDNVITGNVDIASDDLIIRNFDFAYPITKIISSPLKRCVSTIEKYILDTCCNIEYVTCDLLKERDMGDLSGISKKKAILKYPDLIINYNNIISFNPFKTPPNGESFDAFVNRITYFLNQLDLKKYSYLLCSHNQTLKMIYHIIKGIPITYDSWLNSNFKNGTVKEVEF